MSQENVDTVRLCYELTRRGDIAALVDLADPEVEVRENVLPPDSAVYRGPDGLRKWFEVSQRLSASSGLSPSGLSNREIGSSLPCTRMAEEGEAGRRLPRGTSLRSSCVWQDRGCLVLQGLAGSPRSRRAVAVAQH